MHSERPSPSLPSSSPAPTLAACGSDDDSSSGADTSSTTGQASAEPVTLRLGYFPNVTHAPALVGIEGGIFEENLGDNVTLETIVVQRRRRRHHRDPRGRARRLVHRPQPRDQRVPAVERRGDPHRLRCGIRRRVPRHEARHHDAPRTSRARRSRTPQLGNTQDVALRAWLKEEGLSTDTVRWRRRHRSSRRRTR